MKKIKSPIPQKSHFDNLSFLAPNNVHLTVLKRSEWNKNDSIIIRFAEVSGFSIEATVFLPSHMKNLIKHIYECDLLERPLEKQNFIWNKTENELKFPIGKFEVKTFEIHLSK